MRTKSLTVSECSSTRMGKRPCSSGMRSLGLETWKAPAAMKRMWSVETMPYLVLTVVPSTMGRMSRCTPSRRDVGAVAAFASGDLVDLVEEDDAGVFDALDGEARDLVHVDEAALFFLDEVVEGLDDLHLALLGALAEEAGEHVLEVDVHVFRALGRR